MNRLPGGLSGDPEIATWISQYEMAFRMQTSVPVAQGDERYDHLAGFTMWLAGGGFRGGLSYGATDELGYHAAENRVSVHDLHATLLHQLGIDHLRFAVKFQGLDARLTGVEPAQVVQALL